MIDHERDTLFPFVNLNDNLNQRLRSYDLVLDSQNAHHEFPESSRR